MASCDGEIYRRLFTASQEVHKTFAVAFGTAVAAGAGAGIGTVFMPGIGTLVGGAIGVLAAALGAQISEAKSIQEILEELDGKERQRLVSSLIEEFGDLTYKTVSQLRDILNDPRTTLILKAILAARS